MSSDFVSIREWMSHQRDETDDRFEMTMGLFGKLAERLARVEERHDAMCPLKKEAP